MVRYEADAWDHDSAALMLTFTHYRVSDGAIVDSDILINGVGYRWRADGQSDDNAHEDESFDLQNSLTHEVGHFELAAHGQSAKGANQGPVYTHHEVIASVKVDQPGMLYALAYCNIHGLWQSSRELKVQ